MKYFATSIFLEEKENLCKKKKNNYHCLPHEICKVFGKNTTYDTVLQLSDTVSKVEETHTKIILKTRFKNSLMQEGKSGGFRLISILDIVNNTWTFISVYPKKGAFAKTDLTKSQYEAAIIAYREESLSGTLVELDIEDNLSEIEDKNTEGLK